eukprot:XP_003723993.1 PREDICTED: vasopressin V1a receptor-like [Strongylocentrotus purpuratus]
MADEQEDDFDFDEDEIVKLVSVVILCILGIPGNTIILLVYAKKKKRISTDILIIVQAIIDFVASVFAPLVLLKTAYSNLVTDGICVVTELTENGSAFSSLFLMMVISVDRYLLVCRPLGRRVTTRTAVVVSVCCVLVAMAMMLPRTIYTRAVNTDLELEVNCEFPLSHRATVIVSVMFPVTFIITMLITLVLYGRIYMFLRRQAKVHAALVGNGPGGTDVPLPPSSVTPPANDASTIIATQLDSNETAVEQYPTSIEQKHVSERLPGRLENQSLYQPTDNDTGGATSNLSAVESHAAAAASTATSVTGQPGNVPRKYTAGLSVAKAGASSAQSGDSKPEAASQNAPLKHPKKRVAHIRGRSTTKMLLCITIYFIITWLPLITITLLQQRVIRNLTTNLMAIIIGAFDTFRSTNHVVNIFVYIYTNVPFRKAARKLFTLEGIKGKLW